MSSKSVSREELVRLLETLEGQIEQDSQDFRNMIIAAKIQIKSGKVDELPTLRNLFHSLRVRRNRAQSDLREIELKSPGAPLAGRLKAA